MAARAKARTRRSSEPSAKNARSEYHAFTQALNKILSVSHSELKSKIDSERRVRKPKRASSSREEGA